MIFVTVGTHEQPFNRLIEYIDKLVETGKINEKIIMQTGYSTYAPKNCKWHKLFSYNEMKKNIEDARIVITHGGPSSFIMPLQIGKVPIVVPRRKDYGEHVNNHQVKFLRAVAKKKATIIVVEEMDKLLNTIENYDQIIGDMKGGINSNNDKFCKGLGEIVDEMFGEKR